MTNSSQALGALVLLVAALAVFLIIFLARSSGKISFETSGTVIQANDAGNVSFYAWVKVDKNNLKGLEFFFEIDYGHSIWQNIYLKDRKISLQYNKNATQFETLEKCKGLQKCPSDCDNFPSVDLTEATASYALKDVSRVLLSKKNIDKKKERFPDSVLSVLFLESTYNIVLNGRTREIERVVGAGGFQAIVEYFNYTKFDDAYSDRINTAKEEYITYFNNDYGLIDCQPINGTYQSACTSENDDAPYCSNEACRVDQQSENCLAVVNSWCETTLRGQNDPWCISLNRSSTTRQRFLKHVDAITPYNGGIRDESRRRLSATTCDSSWIGDGYCDPQCNTNEHDYDGGDCCSGTCLRSKAFACGYNGYNCQLTTTRRDLASLPMCIFVHGMGEKACTSPSLVKCNTFAYFDQHGMNEVTNGLCNPMCFCYNSIDKGWDSQDTAVALANEVKRNSAKVLIGHSMGNPVIRNARKLLNQEGYTNVKHVNIAGPSVGSAALTYLHDSGKSFWGFKLSWIAPYIGLGHPASKKLSYNNFMNDNSLLPADYSYCGGSTTGSYRETTYRVGPLTIKFPGLRILGWLHSKFKVNEDVCDDSRSGWLGRQDGMVYVHECVNQRMNTKRSQASRWKWTWIKKWWGRYPARRKETYTTSCKNQYERARHSVVGNANHADNRLATSRVQEIIKSFIQWSLQR